MTEEEQARFDKLDRDCARWRFEAIDAVAGGCRPHQHKNRPPAMVLYGDPGIDGPGWYCADEEMYEDGRLWGPFKTLPEAVLRGHTEGYRITNWHPNMDDEGSSSD